MSPRLRRFALGLPLALLGLALLGEGALRVRQYLRYGTLGNLHSFAVHAETGLRIPIPGQNTGRVTIDERGFRSPPLEVPKPEGRQRLAFLGGSTTFCAEVSGDGETWPSLVARDLAQDLGQGADLDFLNAGVPGYVVDSSSRSFLARVRPCEPDLVFIYHAYNDLVVDSREPARVAGAALPEAQVDWLGERSLLWHLLRQNLLVRGKVDRQQQGQALADFDPEPLAAAFGQRLERLVQDVREAGAEPVLITFAYRGRRGMDAAAQAVAARSAVRYMPFLSPIQVLEGLEAYNGAIRVAAAAQGTALVECAELIPADAEHFADSVHLTDQGCRRMAELVVEGVRAADLLGAPAER